MHFFNLIANLLSLISIFSYTALEYASLIRAKLGKGYNHALILYQEWFRTGKVSCDHPSFGNAHVLYQAIVALTDFSYTPLSSMHNDGTTGKILLKTDDQLEFESVLIPMQAGGTLCLSSQVGCRMGCAFCETGRMGLLRNLSIKEIVSQLFIARFILNFSIRNLVFMGMGEPFDNYDAVMQAVRIFTDPHGFGLGAQHLTISTSGCIPYIYRFMNETGALPHLAISLSAPTDELRNRLMPINRQFPLKELYKAMEVFCKKTKKQILVAYVLIQGQNDTLQHATQLAHYLKGLDVKVNLIPYNAQSRDRFCAPSQEILEKFANFLRQEGFMVLLRQTKGDKIMAACGQLGNLELKKQKKRIHSLALLSE